MGEDVIGGRCPSWQAMVSVNNFHRSARARPPPADTPDESSAATTPQVTPSIQDFAVSLFWKVSDLIGESVWLTAGVPVSAAARGSSGYGVPGFGLSVAGQ
jgi:hypothetical protein